MITEYTYNTNELNWTSWKRVEKFFPEDIQKV